MPHRRHVELTSIFSDGAPRQVERGFLQLGGDLAIAKWAVCTGEELPYRFFRCQRSVKEIAHLNQPAVRQLHDFVADGPADRGFVHPELPGHFCAGQGFKVTRTPREKVCLVADEELADPAQRSPTVLERSHEHTCALNGLADPLPSIWSRPTIVVGVKSHLEHGADPQFICLSGRDFDHEPARAILGVAPDEQIGLDQGPALLGTTGHQQQRIWIEVLAHEVQYAIDLPAGIPYASGNSIPALVEERIPSLFQYAHDDFAVVTFGF
jgi:hypothetical protein